MPAKPRIIHVVRPDADELREHIVALTSGLAERRIEAMVVASLSRRFREDLSRHGVRWTNLPIPEDGAARSMGDAAGALRKLVLSAPPVLMHAHGLQAAGIVLSAMRHGSAAPIPLVCSPHGISDTGSAGAMARLRKAGTTRYALTHCDAIIASSQAEREALLRLAGRRRSRLDPRTMVVPLGVQRRDKSGLFDVGEKRFRVGLHRDAAIVAALAPLRESSHIEDLLRAARTVSADMPNVEFAIIGDGPHIEHLKQFAHELGLTGNTIFLGNRPDVLDVVSTCNVLVALTDDAYGIIHALEALARDLRVVSADLPGLREIFAQTETVPLVPLSDRSGLARAICSQLEGMTSDEDSIQTESGLTWGVSEALASQDEYDLDEPGLDPRDRSAQLGSDVARLLEHHSVAKMLTRTVRVYNDVLASV